MRLVRRRYWVRDLERGGYRSRDMIVRRPVMKASNVGS